MIKKEYSGSARRARNIIWNAAGRYDFEPPFMAFFPNGQPDHYFNMIAGLVEKWLDMPRLWAFFKSYEDERRADEFDDFLWLGLENCVYEKELPERPMMQALRRARAEQFYIEQQSLSRQQMEYQSMPVYTQQEARWAACCGKRPPLLSPREKRMCEALCFSGALDTDGVLNAMTSFLQTFFHFTPAEHTDKRREANALTRLLFRHEHRQMDHLLVRAGTGEGDHPKAVQQRHAGLGRHVAPTEEDEAYIRAVFGRSDRTQQELHILENELCGGPDEGCRLWITRGELEDTQDKDSREIRESAKKQQARNEKFLVDNAAAMQSSIRALTTRMETVFSSYFKHQPEVSRAGHIRPELAYRLPVLQDTRVFLKDGEETEPEVCVDLLLDASQSRMHSQEVLSAEASIIAKSLEKLHIPVRVTSFRSLRGFTVLEILKNWNQSDCRGLTRYYAGGWNRDGLAIEALGRLADDAAVYGRQRIVLVLTDASPNDSTPLPPTNRLTTREYEGAAAVKATEEAVRSLRSRGVRVGAVFHGNSSHLENLHQIYGHAYVRIRKPSQLAQGVSDLLLMLLREMRTD
ncbi:MAG: VWA domain-containing protein [Oscillospiraceae bacterium]|nr:VWA domain-containing protein [Oscillospiraceae bacterium]